MAATNLPRHPRATEYAHLVSDYGPGRLADALLAKWLSDPDAGEQWLHLSMIVAGADAIYDAELIAA